MKRFIKRWRKWKWALIGATFVVAAMLLYAIMYVLVVGYALTGCSTTSSDVVSNSRGDAAWVKQDLCRFDTPTMIKLRRAHHLMPTNVTQFYATPDEPGADPVWGLSATVRWIDDDTLEIETVPIDREIGPRVEQVGPIHIRYIVHKDREETTDPPAQR